MSHDDLLAQSLTDLHLDGDRQVHVGGDNDLETVHGLENVEQSAGIDAGDAVRPLLGQSIDRSTLEKIESDLARALRQDPQLADVKRVEIEEVDRRNNTVVVRAFVGLNNEFTLNITV